MVKSFWIALLVVTAIATSGCSSGSVPAISDSRLMSDHQQTEASKPNLRVADTCPGCVNGSCTTWYVETFPGIEDPSIDDVLGTTCPDDEAGYGGAYNGTCSGYCYSSPILPPNTVALLNPTPGEICDSSQLALGSQWPVDTTNYANEVTNIYALSAKNASGDPGIAGWMYQVGGPTGPMYISGNPAFKTFWTALGEGVPGIGPFISSFDDGTVIVPANSSQASQLNNYFTSHGGKVGSCFTKSLPRNEA